MKRKRKLFDKPSDYFILAAVIAFLYLMSTEVAFADWAVEITHDSNAGTTNYNAGLDRICGRYFFDTGSSAVFCPIVGVRGTPKSDSFELGIADELWPRREGQITLNRYDGVMDGGFTVRRVMGDGKFQGFLGGSYWIDESPGSNSKMTFNLGFRYTF